MGNFEEFRELERRVMESMLSGVPLKEDLKTLMMYYFHNMELKKLGKFIQKYTKFFGENDREVCWLKFMLRFMSMAPLREPREPVQAFYYYLYYIGDVRRALQILEDNRETIRAISPELMHSLYIQVFNLLGRMYVIPGTLLEGMDGPIDAYLSLNRAIGGDLLAAVGTFHRGNFALVLAHPFSKRLAIVGRMITALMEGDYLTYEIMLRNFKREGERLLYIVGRIFGSMFDPSLRVEDDEIPNYMPFFRSFNRYVREGGRDTRFAQRYRGAESFLWHMRRVREGEVYLSFGGKVRLLRGMDEVRLPRRKALIILAIIRSTGTEDLRGMARYLFPSSPRPMKTVYDYMRFIRKYRFVPTNLKFTLHSGTFLYDEKEPWAEVLKEKMRRDGRLNSPVVASS